MKQAYETPQLVTHGTIEQMTQLIGSHSATDTIIWGNRAFDPPGLDAGSQDLVIPRGLSR
jgi:hypothetical protein